MLPTLLTAWAHEPIASVGTKEWAWIPPDGCQDLIGVQLPDGRTHWHVFELASHASSVLLTSGSRVHGYRLMPGTEIDRSLLLGLVQDLPLDAEATLRSAVAEVTRLDARVHDALQALASCATVALAARHLGVSTRTLERLICRATCQRPVF